ncbi:hypothetical protein [Thaumasiovibrio sp. DFM-14]|uniref:hypothetical protein n=1 Tax=Thaumasiovibrio sp. DFM-14 TaxID=3384792 RepID=UPI0039A048AF
MLLKKNVFAVLLASLALGGCNSDSNPSDGGDESWGSVVESIQIPSQYYPDNFREELQVNLDYFIDGIGVSPQVKVPYEHIFVKDDKVTRQVAYTNSTTIGLYLNILVEMVRAGDDVATDRLHEVLGQLEAAPKWYGLFHWLYLLRDTDLAASPNGIISAVDNGNLSFSLAAVYGAFVDSEVPELRAIAMRADRLLADQRQGWSRLYDAERGFLRAGWDTAVEAYLPYYIDRKANESRLGTLWAVLSTDSLASHESVPESAFTDMLLYTKAHNRDGDYYEPMLTWDGSYFQALLPGIWVDEATLIPDYQMIEDFSQIHMNFAVENNIPFMSASSTTDNGYLAYGIEAVSESYQVGDNDIHQGNTGTPHATALYALIDQEAAIDHLLMIKAMYPEIESKAGWFDALDSNGNISEKIIGLDQGMFTAAFFASSIHVDVKRYLDEYGLGHLIDSLYQSFVSDELVEERP